MISKEKLKEHIDKLPDKEISIDELIDRLVFIEKLENRIAISEQNKTTLSEDSVREEASKWSR